MIALKIELQCSRNHCNSLFSALLSLYWCYLFVLMEGYYAFLILLKSIYTLAISRKVYLRFWLQKFGYTSVPYSALPIPALSNPSQTITVPFCTNPISLIPPLPPSPFLLPSSSFSYRRQLIIFDIGLNRMIFESSIHKTDVITERTTPPQPKSNDHEVVKTRPGSSSCIPLPPGGMTTPSAEPSKRSVSTRGFCCIRLKWIIVRVNRANEAVKDCGVLKTRMCIVFK